MKNLDLTVLLIVGSATGCALSWWARSGDAAVAAVLPCLQAAVG